MPRGRSHGESYRRPEAKQFRDEFVLQNRFSQKASNTFEFLFFFKKSLLMNNNSVSLEARDL